MADHSARKPMMCVTKTARTGSRFTEKRLQHISEHKDAQRHDADQHKYNRVAGAYEPVYHIPALLPMTVHPV